MIILSDKVQAEGGGFMNIWRPVGVFAYLLFIGSIAPALWLAVAWQVHQAVPGADLGAKIGAIPLLYPSLLAGLAAITAAATAYLAAAVKTAEDVRQAEIARRDARHSALLLCSFVAQQVHGKCGRAKEMASKMELVGFMPDELGGGEQISAKYDEYLRVDLPSALSDLLKNMALLSSVVRDALREMTIGLEEIRRVTEPKEDEGEVEYVHDRGDLIRSYERVIDAAEIVMSRDGEKIAAKRRRVETITNKFLRRMGKSRDLNRRPRTGS